MSRNPSADHAAPLTVDTDPARNSAANRVEVATLSVNYRTPAEIMAYAAPMIRAALPDANVPTSIRHGGVPVARRPVADLRRVLDGWLADHADGTACVIGVPPVDVDALPATPRVRSLTPELAKGLEFDLVVVVDPASFGDGVTGGRPVRGDDPRHRAAGRAGRPGSGGSRQPGGGGPPEVIWGAATPARPGAPSVPGGQVRALMPFSGHRYPPGSTRAGKGHCGG
ncbi:hypothetical protein O7632_23475 [Solwaraspora sp. WMMD406]|uniref:hypothetical protein n=1 Tax=Solwaraspora sp. WMMD406 TaxID=3016095 RepID=UPI002415C6D5|nr:hypothetical protein [Solwaraspora sp. WMMD406]MDG4767035.1 hypothetical protein [Solwaraspora sp. WMMD406]